MSITAAVGLGFLMDCVLGDPERLWHPIMGIGSMISFWSKTLRKWFPKSDRGQFWAGVCLWNSGRQPWAALPRRLPVRR